MTTTEFQRLLDTAEGTDAKLDVVFQTFDQLHTDGDFGAADTLLHYLDPGKLGEDLTVGILTITHTARHLLSERMPFLLRAHEVYSKDILKGL